MDTGADSPILDPKLLPDKYWETHTQYFTFALGNTFATKVRSQPIKIQFFPHCSIVYRVLGSPSLDQDLIIGWDILTRLPSLKIMPNGLNFTLNFESLWKL